MEIYTDSLAEAHEAACDAILNRHKEIDIQTHIDKKEFTLEFEDEFGNPDEIKLKIYHPFSGNDISPGSTFYKRPLFTMNYATQFLTLTPPREDGNHATYTYWNRLNDYPFSVESRTGQTIWAGNGDGHGFKQVHELCKKLAADPNSRRGVMVTWNPLLDSQSREPPCMNWLQVVIRNGVVHLRVVFRSQDMLLGLPENLIGTKALLAYIVDLLNTLGLDCIAGTLTLISTIPHIYKKRDAPDLDLMRARINELKMYKLWHPRVVE